MDSRRTPESYDIAQADITFDHFVGHVDDGSHCMRLAPQPSPSTAIYMNEAGDWWIDSVTSWQPIDYAPWDMVADQNMDITGWFSEDPWDDPS